MPFIGETMLELVVDTLPNCGSMSQMGISYYRFDVEGGSPTPSETPHQHGEKERLDAYRKELQGHGQVLLRSRNPEPNKSFVSFVACRFELLARRMPHSSCLGGY